MIGHILAKLYGTILQSAMSTEAESRRLHALGQAGFRTHHSTTDHVFTLRAIIEQARFQHSRVYCCFVDFRKAFDSVPRHLLIQRLHDLGFSTDMILAVMALYERVWGCFRSDSGVSDPISSTIGVKQGCSLSPTLFGLYIDELENMIGQEDGCRLADILIAILLYADDVALLSHTPEGLQRQLDRLHSFCTRWGLCVNIRKTKVMVFNTSSAVMHRQEFVYGDQSLEIVSSYTYLGILFTGPSFSMRQAGSIRLGKGHSSLVQLERFCFRKSIQDAHSKCHLFDTLVTPTALYSAEAWCTGLTSSDWASLSRLQISMLSRMIRAKPSVPHSIILAEFAVPPLQVGAIYQLISYIQRVRQLPQERYPHIALMSSMQIHTQGARISWYSQVIRLLDIFGISITALPEGTHQYIRRRIYHAYIQHTWQG